MNRTIVIGGGIIGYACAWQLALRKHRVLLIADRHSSAAEHSAGILFPNHLSMIDEEEKVELAHTALRSWPVWAESLGDSSFRRHGMLQAFGEDRQTQLSNWADTIHEMGWEADLMSVQQIADRLPHLHINPEQVVNAFWVPEVYGVDPQHHLGLLDKALHHAGGKVLRTEHVTRLLVEDNQVVGVQWPDGSRLAADHVVAATGWSDYSWLPQEVRPQLQAHMGEHAVLRVAADWPQQPILVFPGTTAVQRSRNRMWLGVTVRPDDDVSLLTVGGALNILQHARNLMPDLAKQRILEAGAGIRPVSSDAMPWVGPTQIDGLLLATGHGRSGILQAPIAAEAIAEYIEHGELPEWSGATDPKQRLMQQSLL